MDSLTTAIMTSVWLGIMMSISPCPLATNIAAVAFIGQRIDKTWQTLLAGLFYTLGRILSYTIIGIVISVSFISVSELSMFLQNYMNKIIGPILIVTGMFLLELIQIKSKSGRFQQMMQNRAEKSPLAASGFLGFMFALSFCPVSAALFFGSLIPLAIKFSSPVILPAMFGVGSGVPVILFSLLLVFSTASVSKIFDKLGLIEKWMRKITGILLLLIGIYLSLKFIFKIIP